MNKYVLIPHEEYIRFKDYLKNKTNVENNEAIKDKSLIQSTTVKSDNILSEMKDKTQGYQENKSIDKDTLRDIKANSLREQETVDVLPPPGFPMQKAEPSVFFSKELQQTGNGSTENWIANWKKYVR